MNAAILKQSPEIPRDQSSDSERSGGFSLDLKRSFKMHKTLAISVAVGISVVLLAYGLSRRPYYETHALIYVQPVKAKLTTDNTGATYDPARYDTYINQQLQTITRTDILAEALSKPATVKWRFPQETDDAAIDRLRTNLKVERDQGSYQLSITLAGSDPEAIADVVNAVSEAYIHGERSDELAQSDQQLQILKTERDRLRNNLSSDRQEQAALSAALGVADTTNPEVTNPFDVTLTDLRAQLAAATAQHAIAAAQFASVSQTGSDSSAGLRAAAEDASANDPGLAALKQTISQRRSVLVSQMAGLTPKNPLYKQDQDELTRLDQWLDAAATEVRTKAARQLQEKLRLDANRTATLQSRLEGELAQKTAVASGATPKLQRAADLVMDITRLQTHFTEIDSAINAIELEKNTSGLVHILLPAAPPSKPKASKKIFIIGGAVPLGILFGLMAAVLSMKMDPRVYIAEDVSRALDFKPMAVLPHHRDVKSSVMDEFMLRLVAGVDQAHRTGGARTFVFTAASSGSSISKMVAALARKIERFGYTTLIVDAAEVMKHVALPKDEMAYLMGDGQVSKSSRIAPARRENFNIGNFSRMRSNVDLLFIEGLPLLSSAETEFAARLSDITILVAESEKTTRGELTNALELLKRLGVPGVAAVLSKVKTVHADDEFLSVIHDVETRQSEMPEQEPIDFEAKAERIPLRDDPEVYSRK
ncbi:Uncharacterized protein involved in exopolysaccharide biosynthesis [Granulicella pectinivorans]|jgi:uncharacterized protein involved in exopolysaccharide biosynthesis|uniref:Uncharacterized protein involved in exopolysaccharide biosynthesis n=1 Tax=Granulicella pectinivorans TaxID=474950 RepID=A0A1I6LUI4_9BACT|nr:hypothetical protein [Granulicella pectinivorans]SFS07151.1 Uncharacterized protein involved in exopolysaccharide biosynthesis [Granulicella pectinivorans]